MTVSFFVECNDCEKKYRIRYGMGNNFPQSAIYQCKDCSRNIEIGFAAKNTPTIIKGAVSIPPNDELYKIATVQNLHPEIPTFIEDQNNPYFFQTTNAFQNLFKENTQIEIFRKEQQRWEKFNTLWSHIETPLRIYINNGEEKLISITKMTYEELYSKIINWIESFMGGIFEIEYDKVCEEYNSINKNEIKNYLRSDKTLPAKIYLLFTAYMQKSMQFQGTLIYQWLNWEITEAMTTNANWEEISSVYGDIYEVIGDLYLLPTMINNIKSGRRFNEFITDGFTLEKYIKTDKAKRAENFDNNPNFSFLSKSYHSWLRNGTHHKNSFLDRSSLMITLGTGKGGGIQKEISLVEYIKLTNEIFAGFLMLSGLIFNCTK